MTASPGKTRISRRRVVGAAGAAVALTAAGPAPAAAAASTTKSYLAADAELHLLRRATYGPTAASVAEIRRLGTAAWLDRQLDPAAIADPACDALLTRFPLIELSIGEVRSRVRAGTLRYGWDTMLQLGFAATSRAIWSERQLLEVMVDFWSNHLNVTNPAGDVWDSRQDYDRTVIRPHALGRFADLLKASARHPAMLTYLDNRFSTKYAPNENYGRELLELHTVGLGYTESDVKDAARLLTGLTVDWDTGGYKYSPNTHATGPVQVAGFRHDNATAAGGETAVLALLDHLARHPATARHIATKLCVRFVADNPPASLVNRLAKVYLEHRSAIVPVLRALFGSPEFRASAGAKIRTPYEDIVATVRAVGYGPDATGTAGIESLYWLIGSLGQAPLSWAPPNGYPDVAAAWTSPGGVLARWNAHLHIVAGYRPKEFQRPADLAGALVGALPATYGELIDALARRLFGRTLPAEHRSALAAYFGKTAGTALRPSDSAVGWRLPQLVALMLNSPYFAVR
ncbi:hypothetical protein Ani05nite_12200 [Amorphoplanes nipponensis]|uniref:DUF1800 domain-containing protein n=2 Tax=Actinoplanes nipponensis TaxID=135950 RepID=A0A919JEG2_9ACTN|nr:DUF1800 domain-containing protein [Actinoplanes nipponensis]GIE47686.1 hypothetical protein Ani05nite_12200 [Actinoplanes nipponensis]